MAAKGWRMPAWMRPYCSLFVNTGREPTKEAIEEMANGKTDAVINLPLAMLEACVHSQVLFLTKLHNEGMLK